eukprot:5430217-Lingulodinium_polyedra.AAC.1
MRGPVIEAETPGVSNDQHVDDLGQTAAAGDKQQLVRRLVRAGRAAASALTAKGLRISPKSV